MKFNITIRELKRATEFALKNGVSEFSTITMEVKGGSGIGDNKFVSKIRCNKQTEITDYDAW